MWVREAPFVEMDPSAPPTIDCCSFCGRKTSALYYDSSRPGPYRVCARCIQAARLLLAPTLGLLESGVEHALENGAGEFEVMPYAEIAKRLGRRRS